MREREKVMMKEKRKRDDDSDDVGEGKVESLNGGSRIRPYR